jgi:dihydroorotate dehydrogenase
MLRESIFSSLYKRARKKAIAHQEVLAKKAGRTLDFESVILEGESKLERILNLPGAGLAFDFSVPSRLRTQLYDLHFDSPITFSSFQGDFNQIEMWLRMGIGGGVFKTILMDPRPGNDRPRIEQVTLDGEEHLLNAYGLPGKGVNAFRDEVRDSPLWSFGRPLGLSVGGHDPEEYFAVFSKLHETFSLVQSHPYYYEVNISCPNTNEGKNLLKHPNLLEALLKKMRDVTGAVIVVKLSPDQSDDDLKTFAEVVSTTERTALNLGNTQYKTSSTLSRGGGGLSGPSLFPRTLEMVNLLNQFELPIIATGGVDSEDKVITILEAGARCVGMATALVKDPYIIPRVNAKLAAYWSS